MARGTHTDLIRDYLFAHPGSTTPQIRDGIERTNGIRIERVQARLHRIKQDFHLTVDTSGDLARYTLGSRRDTPRGRVQLRVSLPDPLDDDDYQDLLDDVQATVDRWYAARDGAFDYSSDSSDPTGLLDDLEWC